MRDDVREFLREGGARDEDIVRAETEGWLPLLVLDRLLMAGPARYDITALAVEAGVGEAVARRLWRTIGFPDVPPGVVAFTDRDLEILKLAVRRLGVGADDNDDFFRQARVISAAMARIAAIDADLIADALADLRASGASDDEAAAVLVDAIDWPSLALLLDHVHRLHARAAIWRRLGRAVGDLDVAVGFADLAGYTPLAERLDPDELTRLLARWEEVAYDCVSEHGARVVKTIGDEVMFVGLPEAAARTALALRRAADDDAVLPPVRIGLASGQVVARYGDFYGPVVNLASRLAEDAEPGSILVSAPMSSALAGASDLPVASMGPRTLRGIGDVEVFRLG